MAQANDQKSWIRCLQQEGWTLARGGKHQIKMAKPGRRPITLPMHKGAQYPKGLNAARRRQADLQSGRA